MEESPRAFIWEKGFVTNQKLNQLILDCREPSERILIGFSKSL